MKSLAFTKGPWRDDFRWKVTLTYEQKCNKDSEGKPRCPKSHQLKRFDAAFENGRGDTGLGCDLCGKFFQCPEGYYNCGEGCNWDVCAVCFEKEVSK